MESQLLLFYRTANRHFDNFSKKYSCQFELASTYRLSRTIDYLTNRHVVAIIAELPTGCSPPIDDICYLEFSFPTCPIFLLGNISNLKKFQASFDGSNIYCTPYEGIDVLLTDLPSLLSNCSFSVDFKVFDVVYNVCSVRIKKALRLIAKEFLRKDLTVSKIAFQLNIHRCHFEREFQHFCRISPKQLIIGLRLFYATFLMRNDGMKLLHVARLSGFSDYYEFCKIFRRHMGMTPTQFRSHLDAYHFKNYFVSLPKSATKPQKMSH